MELDMWRTGLVRMGLVLWGLLSGYVVRGEAWDVRNRDVWVIGMDGRRLSLGEEVGDIKS